MELLAHQGGWDEIAMVAVPVAVLFVMLAVANRRAKAIQRDQTPEPTPDS